MKNNYSQPKDNQFNSKIVTSNQAGVHEHLDAVVKKYQQTVFQKPIQKHNEIAFNQFQAFRRQYGKGDLILDSCCGTGASSIFIAKQNPDCLVVGIDQSLKRLNKSLQAESSAESTRSKSAQVIPPNCMLLRANCEDFWRLCLSEKIKFKHHYILYPNPWPKAEHLKRRWHGHPVFPVLPQLALHTQVRSNWEIYCLEFARAWQIITGDQFAVEPLQIEHPITLFEKKYYLSGQSLFIWKS